MAWFRGAWEAWNSACESVADLEAPAEVWKTSLGVALVALVIFATLAPAAMPSGDSALYAQQARHFELGERTVHIGYYISAAFFTLFNSQAPDLVFNLFSSLLAAATVFLVVLVTSTLAGRLDLGALAGLSLLASSTFLRQAVWAEVYIGQAFLFLWALWLSTRARPAAAGFALAGSVLYSPSTLLGVPGLLSARPRLKEILLLAFCGSAVVLATLAFVWRDYFFGPRGLFGSSATAGGLKAAVVKEGFEVFFGVTALLPFLFLGAWALLRSARGRVALGILALIWAPTFLLGERYPDVPVQLATWILLAPILVAGLAWLECQLDVANVAKKTLALTVLSGLAALPFFAIPFVATRSRSFALLGSELLAGLITVVLVGGALSWWLARTRTRLALQVFFILCVTASGILAARLVADQNNEYLAYRAQVEGLKAEAAVDYVAIGSWEQGILLEHYIYGRPYTGHTLNIDELKRGDQEAMVRFEQALGRGLEIWLLSPKPGLHGEVEKRLVEAGRRLEPAAGFLVSRPTGPARPAAVRISNPESAP